MMKIAIFSDIYEPSSDGGIVSAIKAQKAELEKLGHEVTIFCPGFRTREKNVVLVPSRKWPRINNTILARKPVEVEAFILEKFPEFREFDIVHVQYEVSCSIAGIDLAKKFGIPLVITMHGREDRAIELNVPHPFKWLVATVLNCLHAHYLPHTIKVKKDKFQAPTRTRAKMWELMVNHAEQADVVTTPSVHFAQKLEHYGVTKPIVATPGGVAEDLVQIDFNERKMADGDVLKMVWNSRVSKEKRIMPFLKALRQLKRPYMLYVYGNGNQFKKAKEYAKKNGMKVKFFGAQPRERIIIRMQEAHLGVHSSYNFDTQGMVLVEAQATGLPVLITDPALTETVPMGGFLLASSKDPTGIALTLEGLKAEKVNGMSKIMMKNRRKVLQDERVKELVKAYKMAEKAKKK